MSPLEHYRRAEELLEVAAGERRPTKAQLRSTPLELLQAAAVHATLAGVGEPSRPPRSWNPDRP